MCQHEHVAGGITEFHECVGAAEAGAIDEGGMCSRDQAQRKHGERNLREGWRWGDLHLD
jgi:hypothetical protein